IGVIFDMDERSFLQYQRLLRQHQVRGTGSPLYMAFVGEEGFPQRGHWTASAITSTQAPALSRCEATCQTLTECSCRACLFGYGCRWAHRKRCLKYLITPSRVSRA